MRIIFFIPVLSTAGGSERVITTLANYLVRNGHSVQIQTIRNCNSFYDVEERVILKEMETRRSQIPLVRTFQSPILLNKAVKEFAAVVRQYNADIVVSFLSLTNEIAVLARKHINAPIVISERNDPYLAGKAIERFTNKWLYPKADLIICQGERVASYYKALSGKCVVLYNPLNSAAVGDYEEEKKQDSFCRAFGST